MPYVMIPAFHPNTQPLPVTSETQMTLPLQPIPCKPGQSLSQQTGGKSWTGVHWLLLDHKYIVPLANVKFITLIAATISSVGRSTDTMEYKTYKTILKCVFFQLNVLKVQKVKVMSVF